MKPIFKFTIRFWIIFIVTYFTSLKQAIATHAQGTDITYQCLGNNQYLIKLSFYRDCAGVAAPNSASVNVSSASCNQNFSITLNKIPGTGIDVTPICPQLTTQCNGGNYPGVQEYIYTGVVTLPMQCTDWVFGFTLCCRNNAITNIVNPGGENIYVESTLNNLNFNCNNSPQFLNKPIPFVCVGQITRFNNGTYESDGDSISYKLITPKTSPTTTVTYNGTFSANNPLSNSLFLFDNIRGDIRMIPSALEITVLSMVVEEWRNGIMIGSVMRDIQLKTVVCNNTNPYLNGINNTGNYNATACAGSTLSFTIPSFDVDSTQNVIISWDNGIVGANFTSSGGSRPTGTFTWTPTAAHISNNPYCFTILVEDDNCPYSGTQVYSFCITVDGFATTTTATNANCGLANGSASVSASPATGQYSYFWPTCGCTTPSISNLAAGTYSVIVTSTLGCSATSTVTVGDNGGALNVNLTSSNVLCHGANTGSITANASGAQAPYTYAWSNGPTTPNNPNLGAGLYSVTVTSNNGCTAVVAAIINQPAMALTNTISNQSNVSCFGLTNGSVTVSTTGGTAPYSYSWNTTPAQSGATASNLSAGVYSVLVTDANNCSVTTTVTISQPTNFIVNNISSNNVTCYGAANGSASINVSGGTAPYNYLWSTTPAQNNSSTNNLNPGTYSVLVTDANNCTVSSSVTITQPTDIIINTTGIDVKCFGAANGQATASVSGGVPTYSYQWLPSGGTTANINNLSPNSYTVLVTDNNGCTKTSSVTITQPAVLSYTTNHADVTCYGAFNGSVTINVNGGRTPYNYSWNVNNQTASTISNIGGGSYNVTVTDANGCTISTSIIVNEPVKLVANAMVVSNVTCNGLNNGAATIGASGGTTPYSYQWNTMQNQNLQTVGNLSPGVYSVIVTDGNNCTSSASVNITQPPALNLLASGINATCNGMANGQGSAIASGGTPFYNYQWLPNGGNSSNATGLIAGTYTVIATDNNGCTKTAAIVVNQPSPINLTASGSTTICLGQNAVISSTATGGNGNYIYSWTGNGSMSGATQVVSPSVPTTYYVSVVDGNGCPGNTASVTINVTSLTAANLHVSPGVRICQGDTAVIYSSVTGNTGLVTVNWNNGLGSGNGPFTVKPATSTTYIVTVSDVCNNTVTAAVNVLVSPLPVVNIYPLNGKSCEEVPLTFKDSSTTNAGASYYWSFGDGNFSTLVKPTHTYYHSGTYTVNVVVTSVDGCVDSAGTTATIIVYPASHAKFESEAMDGTTVSPIYKFYNKSTNYATYWWNFGDSTTSKEEHPIHEYKQKGEYNVTLNTISKDGCKGYTEMKVAITPEFVIYIPNAFTPDGDGLNDIFIPKGIEIQDFKMEIFSRWGEMIYRTDNMEKGWDGRANFGSDIAQQDVYVYKIQIKDINLKKHDFVGHVTLIKSDSSD